MTHVDNARGQRLQRCPGCGRGDRIRGGSARGQALAALLMIPVIVASFLWGRMENVEERERAEKTGWPVASNPAPEPGLDLHWAWGITLAALIVFVVMVVWLAKRRRTRYCEGCGTLF
ncbi:hypothetical protein ACWEFL_28710 [Streptomyces sp. NPDC004838]